MTYEEFKEKAKFLEDKINVAKQNVILAEHDLKSFYVEFAKELNQREEYKKYFGKKVKIIYKSNSWDYKYNELIGYYSGFVVSDNILGLDIKLNVYKCKKDGTASINSYAEYKLPKFEKIESITLID